MTTNVYQKLDSSFSYFGLHTVVVWTPHFDWTPRLNHTVNETRRAEVRGCQLCWINRVRTSDLIPLIIYIPPVQFRVQNVNILTSYTPYTQ